MHAMHAIPVKSVPYSIYVDRYSYVGRYLVGVGMYGTMPPTFSDPASQTAAAGGFPLCGVAGCGSHVSSLSPRRQQQRNKEEQGTRNSTLLL